MCFSSNHFSRLKSNIFFEDVVASMCKYNISDKKVIWLCPCLVNDLRKENWYIKEPLKFNK